MSTLPSGSYVSKFFFLSLLILRLGLLFYPNGNFPICTFLQDLLSSPTCTLMDILVVAIGVQLAIECLLSCFTFVRLDLSGLFQVIRCRDIMSTTSSVLMIALSVISLLHLHWVFRIVRSVWVENYLVVIQLLHVLLVAVIALQTAIQGIVFDYQLRVFYTIHPTIVIVVSCSILLIYAGVYLVCAQCAHLRGRLITVLRKGKDRFGNQMKLQAFFNIVFGVYTVSLLVITHTSKVELENYELVIFSVCACGQVLYRACCVSVEYHLAQTHTPIHIEEPIEASEDPPVPHELDIQAAVNLDGDQSSIHVDVAHSKMAVKVPPYSNIIPKHLAEPVPKHELCGLLKDHRTERYKHSQIVFPAHCRQLPPGLQNEASELVCPVRKRRVIKQTLNLPVE